ncbi:DUF4383 domain-containing protein [Streptomyces sp. NPDC056161]|uniref:DUF4383 domain-containing protein n=1 Tax=Streptomyces sp. NPDC056161 TaxID=3345732 RepID=UPI0035D9D538
MATHSPPPERRRIHFDEQLPLDHRLNQVYRIGAGLMGLFLVAFGILGLANHIGFFDTGGGTTLGLNTNGSLSVLSICVGVLLFVGMVIGGNFASTLNMAFGILFLLSGFVHLALLETDYNYLAFKIQNVLFSFVVGILLMVFGMYGRVGSTLPHDSPYWRARHPEEAELEARRAGPTHGADDAPELEQRSGPGPGPAGPGTTRRM